MLRNILISFVLIGSAVAGLKFSNMNIGDVSIEMMGYRAEINFLFAIAIFLILASLIALSINGIAFVLNIPKHLQRRKQQNYETRLIKELMNAVVTFKLHDNAKSAKAMETLKKIGIPDYLKDFFDYQLFLSSTSQPDQKEKKNKLLEMLRHDELRHFALCSIVRFFIEQKEYVEAEIYALKLYGLFPEQKSAELLAKIYYYTDNREKLSTLIQDSRIQKLLPKTTIKHHQSFINEKH